MIGEKIQSMLKRNRRYASELARYCEVSPQAVGQWIRGSIEPRRDNRERIAEFFGITPQELEYGPVLSLTPLPRTSKIPLKAAIEAAGLMILSELGTESKSSEYLDGMKHRIISTLSDSNLESHYDIRSCQADAYAAGCEHGQRLLDKIQKK